MNLFGKIYKVEIFYLKLFTTILSLTKATLKYTYLFIETSASPALNMR